MSSPRISVLMPVYETEPEHLRQAVESVLAQTFRDFEFLILNDSPGNGSLRQIVDSYGDPRIVYAENERNLGISASRNRLLAMAKGGYLAVMDHDDVCLPERFARQVDILDSRPEVGVVGTLVRNMGSGKVRPLPSDSTDLKKMLMIRCDLCHPSCMMRRSVLEEHGIRYEAMFSPAEDYALFGRLIPVTEFAVVQEVLLHYRAWQGNTSHRRAKGMEAAAQGVHAFLEREDGELWAMAQCHRMERKRYRLLGLPVLLVETTRTRSTWKLFDAIPLWSVRHSLPRVVGLR